MLNKLIRYFDLQSDYRPHGPKAHAAGDNAPLAVIPQYLALVPGIGSFRHRVIAGRCHRAAGRRAGVSTA